jgi:hypothetical protein
LSPQTRRGREVPASRKMRGRPNVGPHPATTDESVAGDQPLESHLPSEGKRAKIAPLRRKTHHGTAYRWFTAYLPMMGGLFVLLAVLWVYTSVINPPAPTPAQQWTKIADKWSPPREKARADVAASTLDFPKQKAAYQDFYNQTKGWVDAVTAATTVWASPSTAADDVTNFESDGKGLLSVLQRAIDATTAYDVAGMAGQIGDLDSSFTQDVVNVGQDLAIVNSSPSAPPLAVPSVNETPTPVPSPTAGSSSSPGSSASPVASPTVSPVPSSTAS